MPEERMICEKTIVEVEHDGTGEGVSSFGITLAWVPVEPAPPKGWVPACAGGEMCDIGVKMGWIPCLMKCPYRKQGVK